MGDRGNIHIYYDDDERGVYLYTHWQGVSLPRILQEALKRADYRSSDTSYFTRIVFSEMLYRDGYGRQAGFENALLDTTGFGISDEIGDEDHPKIEVHIQSERVYVPFNNHLNGWYSFEEYLKLDIPWDCPYF